MVSYLNSLAKSHHQVHRIVRGLNGVGVYLCTGWVLSSVIFMLIRPISSHHVAQLAPSQNPNFMQRFRKSPYVQFIKTPLSMIPYFRKGLYFPYKKRGVLSCNKESFDIIISNLMFTIDYTFK